MTYLLEFSVDNFYYSSMILKINLHNFRTKSGILFDYIMTPIYYDRHEYKSHPVDLIKRKRVTNEKI